MAARGVHNPGALADRSFAALTRAPVADLPPRPDAPPVVVGRYRLGAELGRGGMGRVYSAFDEEIGREVAVKVLLPEAALTRDDLDRFVLETRVTGQLEHPGIVPVYDVGVTEDGQVYLVMKKVEGRPLSRVVADDDLSQGRMLAAFVDVCDAVAFAHHRGVLHQDLKPDNILLGAFGEVLVVDWGLAYVFAPSERMALDRERAIRETGQDPFGSVAQASKPVAPLSLMQRAETRPLQSEHAR